MAALTSPSDYTAASHNSPSACTSCMLLASRRISTLYKILEAEKQMDAIIFGSAQTVPVDLMLLLLYLLHLKLGNHP